MSGFNIEFLNEAVRLSKENLTKNAGGPFGAVIVRDGKIIAEGKNEVILKNDPTAHAEIQAIRKAGNNLSTYNLKGCEIYTSCEPCPMCLAALYWARIDKIYYANTRKDAAEIGFDDEYIYKELSLPETERDLKMFNKELGSAKKIFEDWKNSAGKILY